MDVELTCDIDLEPGILLDLGSRWWLLIWSDTSDDPDNGNNPPLLNIILDSLDPMNEVWSDT